MTKKVVKRAAAKKPVAKKSTARKPKERFIVDRAGKVYGTIKIR